MPNCTSPTACSPDFQMRKSMIVGSHDPVLFINNCDVVDDGPVELRTAMRLMHMPADHQPWLRAADRGEQLAATEVIHAASRGRDLIAIAVRRLGGDEDVDFIRNSSGHGLDVGPRCH